MGPSRPIEDEQTPSWRYRAAEIEPYDGPPRNVEHAPSSTPNLVLFLDLDILVSTGKEPYRGDVFIEGTRLSSFSEHILLELTGTPVAQRITAVGTVPDKETFINGPKVRKFKGRGHTFKLMSGLGDAHTHSTLKGVGNCVQFDDNFETVVDIRLKQRTMDAFSSPRFSKLLGIDEAMYESLWRPTVAPSGCPRSSGQWPTSISQDSSKAGHELRVASSTGS
ncbi:hypothetical protein FQN55_008681 [Onygenales sp. PD_40]|nr:hypothetical protein FQN55_008681 [Onygenales sp. PD_40]